ncbi:gfo/Idh/MocA family oxidoreductase [Maribellus comscasis]|uniref:Gfo/Idh/MocA family oxidoreductase n=1 Tax=Maribellus comscasis TaxID=2681766 RepID=A0A6I6JVL3_9BACT|nr:Gfo/Idh/MocA family oxidoreductase [Maribellus comscasis]QGY47195.1 gfo/Idh/MocA family oxidoreductase [Maribellus comscasis]
MEHQNKKNQNNESKGGEHKLNRRSVLKGLAGLPVAGIFSYELFKKVSYENQNKSSFLKELDLENISAPAALEPAKNGDLIRVGMIGFGERAVALAKALGFLHPENTARRIKMGYLDDWLAQADLNVAITGICEVFDQRAQEGLEIAASEFRPGGGQPSGLPVKRYASYKEMLADKDIDAVVIATPDHHHARISIEAAKAGKHVYCEKSPAIREDELFELYETVKSSGIVYQLGHQISKNAVFQQARDIIQKNILGKITLIETTTNRNTASGAWIRHLDKDGNPKPGDTGSIDWDQWLGDRPKVPFSIDRFYNWTKWFDYDLGMLGQLFTHEFDAINQLLHVGIPKTAMTSGGLYYWKDNREIPDLLHSVFEYPEKDLTLIYSACLASSRNRGRVIMGNDASMELGGSLQVTVDHDSNRFSEQLKKGVISPSEPMLSINPNSGRVDAVTSATAKYYEQRGLSTTRIGDIKMDVTHLHMKEWIDCIRGGGTPAGNIERAFEEGVTILMAQKSYLEERKVEWDAVNRKII